MQKISYGEFNKVNFVNFVSEYSKLQNIKLEGISSQVIRSGKNLLKLTAGTLTTNGVTITVEEDGLITLNGTITNNNTIYPIVKLTNGLENSNNVASIPASWLKQNTGIKGTHTLEKIYVSGSTTYSVAPAPLTYDGNGVRVDYITTNGNGVSNTTVENDLAFVAIYLTTNGTKFTNYKFYLQVEEGTKNEVTEYEKYGASPSPDYRSPIENVEGKNKVKEINWKQLPSISTGATVTNVNGYGTDYINVDNTKQYIFSYLGIAGSKYIVYYDKDKNFLGYGTNLQINNFTKWNETVYVRLRVDCSQNSVTAFQLEEGTVATDYVPYNSLEIKDIGENLFDKKTNTILTWATGAEVAEEGSVCSKSFMPTTKNKIYATNFNVFVFYYDKKLNYLGNSIDLSTSATNPCTTWTNPNNDSIAFMKVCYRKTVNNNVDMTTKEIMLTESETVKPYKPYQEQKVTFPLGNQKLMEGSYLASDGIHNKRKQYTFTGNETFVKSVENNDYIRFYSPVFADVIKTSGYETIDKFMCTHFEQVADYNNSKNCIALNGKRFYITISKNIVTDVQTFKAWLSEHSITVEYELSEEEIVPYTTEQQEAWEKIKNFSIFIGQNNLTSTALLSAIYIKKIINDIKVEYNLYNNNYINVATRNSIHPKFKLQLLDYYENVIDEITGDISVDNSGSISNNYQQGVRRSISLTFIDTEGRFLPNSNSNLVWANKKFKVFSGLYDVNTGETYWFSQGVYYYSDVTSQRTGSDRLTTINGVDKFGKFGSELGYNQLEATYLIPAGTKVYDAVCGILDLDIGNGYAIDPIEPILDPQYMDEVCPYDISKSPSGYLSEILIELGNIIGCDVYYDADGRFHMDSGTIDFSYSNKPAIWDFSDVLPEYMNPSISTNFADLINTVKVVSNNTNDKIYEYTAVNNNPASPSRVDLIGTKQTYIESASVYSTERAKDYAEYKLNSLSMLQLSISFSCTFLPHLDVNQVVTITDSYYGYNKERFILQSITLPLSFDGTMSITACNISSLPYYESQN